jgi:hypothetical protein
MKKYILDIYRCERDNSRSIVGIIEEVGEKGKKGFNTYDELWDILNKTETGNADKKSDRRNLRKEKRKFPRRETSFFTNYSVQPSSGDEVFAGVIVNESRTGICLLTPGELCMGENILLKTTNRGRLKKAAVCWSKNFKDCHYMTGLEFVN